MPKQRRICKKVSLCKKELFCNTSTLTRKLRLCLINSLVVRMKTAYRTGRTRRTRNNTSIIQRLLVCQRPLICWGILRYRKHYCLRFFSCYRRFRSDRGFLSCRRLCCRRFLIYYRFRSDRRFLSYWKDQ